MGAPTAAAVVGNYVVYAGGGNSVTVTNLQPSTTYYFAVFEFNGSNAGTNYLTTNPATGSQTTAVAYQISGTVRSRGGNGLANVSVTLSSGDTPLSNAVTDSSGNYSFPNVTAGGDYTVTPSSASFTFSPASASFTSLSGNQTADFTGIPRVVISEFRFHGTDPDGIEHEEDDIHVVPDPGVEPDGVISGTAEAVDARIWRRSDGAETHVAGNLEIVDRFRVIVHQPIT
jgi:hypothetical protein